MGDRANLVIAYKSTADAATLGDALPGTVVLYTHSDGFDLGPKLALALRAAKPRWTDSSYGCRIIISHIIGNEWPEEYGYGIQAGETSDNERAVLLVDFEQQKVRRFGNPGEYLSPMECEAAKPTGEWTFAEFAGFTDTAARKAHIGRA